MYCKWIRIQYTVDPIQGDPTLCGSMQIRIRKNKCPVSHLLCLSGGRSSRPACPCSWRRAPPRDQPDPPWARPPRSSQLQAAPELQQLKYYKELHHMTRQLRLGPSHPRSSQLQAAPELQQLKYYKELHHMIRQLRLGPVTLAPASFRQLQSYNN
jgi:hypothetical protein